MQLLKKILSVFGKIWYPIRDNAMFFITMYVLGCLVSYIVLPNVRNAEIYDNTYFELFFDLYVAVCFLWILPKRKGVRRIFRGLFYLIGYSLAIIECFCFIRFGARINQSIILLVRETNGGEASEFIETYLGFDLLETDLWQVLLLLGVHITLTIIWFFAKKRLSYDFFKYYLKKASMFILCLDVILSGAVVWTLQEGWEDTMANKERLWKLFSHKTIADMERALLENNHGNLYQPAYRMAFAVRNNYLINLQLDIIKGGLDKASVDSCSFKCPQIVLIIGESYNKYHSQLFGYEKPTTPCQAKLEKSGMLTKYTNVVSPWNLTSYVFKHLMTTYCVGDSGDWCDYPLFCQLFRKAGYQVNFFTNQFIYHAKDAVYDASGGFFLNDKELSDAQFDVRNEETHFWDEDLIKDYNRLVTPPKEASNAKKKPSLTIFHLMGQHVNYRIRCPKSMFKFTKDDYDLPENKPKEINNIAYYDCAVWYNDSVIGQIVNEFKDEDAIIIHISDHGEEVYGPGSLHHCGRMHTTNITRDIAEQEYEIPMWICCTKKFEELHPEIKAQVVASAKKPFMTDALSHLLLGLAGIDCSAFYKPQYDLFSPHYNADRERLLQHAVDYNKIKAGKK